MNILALDTSFAACSAAIGRGLGAHACEVFGLFEPMQTGQAERIVPMVGEVLATAGMKIDDIDRIAVANGPGSFTGTRIAVAAARAMVLASARVDVVAASSLAVMAERAADFLVDAGGRELIVVVDARRDEVYAQRFQRRHGAAGAVALEEPQVLSFDDAARLGGMGAVDFCGSGAAEVVRRATALGRDAAAHLPDLLSDARDLARLAMRLEPASGLVRPLYLRPADAKPQTGKSIERVHP